MENLKTATISANFGNLLKHDGPAGLVTFLVALPLCLGIALASGASLFSGVIAGIIGGLIVSVLSGSQVSVSGFSTSPPISSFHVCVLTSGCSPRSSTGQFLTSCWPTGSLGMP